MFQRTLLLTAVFLFSVSALNALRDFDNKKDFDNNFRDFCGSACIGDTPDCKECYNRAVNLSQITF